MHMAQVGYEQQYQLRAADGSILWQGTAVLGCPHRIINTGLSNVASGAPSGGDGTPKIPAGCAVTFDNTNPTATPGSYMSVGRDDNPGTSDATLVNIVGKAVASATDGPFIGVCVQPTGATPAGTETGVTPSLVPKYALIAGVGSICAVRTTSGAIAAGSAIIGSATVGLCATGAALNAAVNTNGIVLGQCIKAAAQLASTGFYQAGVYVLPK